MHWIAIAIGGAVGSVLRFGAGKLAVTWLGSYPFGLALINIFGSFLLGLLWGMLGEEARGETWALGLSAGLLGGFTTFSAFSLESIRLIQEGQSLVAAAHILGTCLFSLLGAGIGIWIGSQFRFSSY